MIRGSSPQRSRTGPARVSLCLAQPLVPALVLFWLMTLLAERRSVADGPAPLRTPDACQSMEAANRAVDDLLQASSPAAAISLLLVCHRQLHNDMLLIRMAQIQEQAGQIPKAVEFYRSCEVSASLSKADRRLCTSSSARLTREVRITGLPAGTPVVIQGSVEQQGLAPWEGLRLPFGEYLVEVVGRGQASLSLGIDTLADRPVLVELAQQDRGGSAVFSSGKAPAPVRRSQWSGWALEGAGVCLLMAAGGMEAWAYSAEHDIRNKQYRHECGADNCRGELGSAKGWAWGGGAAVAVAVAAGFAGAMMLHGRGDEQSPATEQAVGLGFSKGGWVVLVARPW